MLFTCGGNNSFINQLHRLIVKYNFDPKKSSVPASLQNINKIRNRVKLNFIKIDIFFNEIYSMAI